MAGICELGADRITHLPGNVIQQILVSLPIKDAAKTSRLSTQWRHHWASIPELVFDDRFAPIPKEAESCVKFLMSRQIMMSIYKSLLVHDGPITKFELAIPELEPSNDEVDQIIRYLSNRGRLEVFDVCFYPGFYEGGPIYKLHSSLFSCIHLKCLKLWHCDFRKPSWFVGFSKLTALTLGGVTLPSDFFGNFLPKYCPVLKDLVSTFCEGPSNLEIVAPCLEEFYFLCEKLQKICFKHAPRLSSVSLPLYRNKIEEFTVELDFSASLPALECFEVDSRILQYLIAGENNVSTRLPTPLHRLKFFTIWSLDLRCLKKARAFVCLIMNSPNLRELSIELDAKQLNQPANQDTVPSITALLEAEDRRRGESGRCLQHLKVFALDEIQGIQVELELVRFVLATAPLLKMVHITSVNKLDPGKASEFMEKVMQLERASKEVEVTYHEHDDDDEHDED